METRTAVVIPARWGASRFPGKVLAQLAGREVVLRVCDAAAQMTSVETIVVATDDERIVEVVTGAGFDARMTSARHRSGTDRAAEIAQGLEAEIVLGLQADEPFLVPSDLDRVVMALADDPHRAADSSPQLATLAAPITARDQWLDPNVVKVVTSDDGRALYFSRSPIPYARPTEPPLPSPSPIPASPHARAHVGVYAWKRQALLSFSAMPPSPLEVLEGLEQLRALEAGWTIQVLPASEPTEGIDTPEDLHRAERRLAARESRPPVTEETIRQRRNQE